MQEHEASTNMHTQQRVLSQPHSVMYGYHKAIWLPHAPLGSIQQIQIKAVQRGENLPPLHRTLILDRHLLIHAE